MLTRNIFKLVNISSSPEAGGGYLERLVLEATLIKNYILISHCCSCKQTWCKMAGWEAWLNQLLTRTVQGQPLKASHHAGIFGFDGSCWCGTDETMKSVSALLLLLA